MVGKNTQKRMTLSFDSEYEMYLFRELASEEAYLTDSSESSVIVRRFIESFDFPTNKNARRLAEGLYNGDGIKQALVGFFALNASGERWSSRYENTRPLVQYAHDLGLRWDLTLDCSHYAYDSFHNNFRHLLDEMKHKEDKADEDAKYFIQSEIEDSEKLYNRYGSGAEPSFSELLSFLLSNWGVIGNSTYTFRTLTSYINISCGWKDQTVMNGETVNILSDEAIDARKELVSLLTAVSLEWDDE